MKAKLTAKGIIKALIIGVALGVILKFFALQALYISSGSMKDTLLVGDYVITEKVSYYFTKPHRGDVVVFKMPDEEFGRRFGFFQTLYYRLRGYLVPQPGLYVKRVIGLPGEELEIRNGFLYINGRLKPNYLFGNIDIKETLIPKNSYFLIGENIDESRDSRSFGVINSDNIVGRVWFIYLSRAPDKCTRRGCGSELEPIDKRVALRNIPSGLKKSERYYICKICGKIYRHYYDVIPHPRWKFWEGYRWDRMFKKVK